MKICLPYLSFPTPKSHEKYSLHGQYSGYEMLPKFLSKLGHEIVVITSTKGPHYNWGFDVCEVGVPKIKDRLSLRSIMFSFKVLKKISETDFDILHFPYNNSSILNPFMAKKYPSVVTLHDVFLGARYYVSTNFREKMGMKWMGIQDMKTCSSVSHVIAISQSVKSDAISGYNVPNDKVTVIPHGVDISWFKPCNGRSVREKLNISEGEFAFLFIGAAVPWKGIDVLMKTAELAQKEGQPFKFVLAGKFLERFKRYATELKLKNVVFAGDISDEELPKFYNAMDAYVHPAYYTSASTAITEAMACGLPIVASKVGGIPEIVQNNYNGFLFDVGEHVKLYKCLKRLSEDRDLRETMGGKSRKIAESKLNWKVITKKHVQIYKEKL